MRFSIALLLSIALYSCHQKIEVQELKPSDEFESVHQHPYLDSIPDGPEGDMIRYGRELILNTAKYIGPEGSAGQFLGNKMNCTNCHLDAGTRPYGYNFFSTYANYPQYRSRENQVMTMEQRVNNCVERPHNGTPLPLDSKEMVAIVTYIKWLGEGVAIGTKVKGSERIAMTFPNRAADPKLGSEIYERECARCHGEDGQGKFNKEGLSYEYPPLWGLDAYQSGSSMFRLIKAAQFIKANMPHDQATWENPKLSDEEAFDVAAYINSPEHVRPMAEGPDYEDIRTKYVDYPIGPYDDPFSQEQHKYGPFQPIIDYRKHEGLYLKY